MQIIYIANCKHFCFVFLINIWSLLSCLVSLYICLRADWGLFASVTQHLINLNAWQKDVDDIIQKRCKGIYRNMWLLSILCRDNPFIPSLTNTLAWGLPHHTMGSWYLLIWYPHNHSKSRSLRSPILISLTICQIVGWECGTH